MTYLFQKGQSGNPSGRPKGSKNSLSVVKDIIFDIFKQGEPEFKARMAEAMAEDPVKFYSRFIFPLLPKDLNIDAEVNTTTTVFQQALTSKDVIKDLDKILKETNQRKAVKVSKPKIKQIDVSKRTKNNT